MTHPAGQIAQLKASMEALEAQRSVLGDEAVDLALKGLRQQLVEVGVEATSPEGTPETPLNQVSSSTSGPEPVSPQALSEAKVISQAGGERRQATVLFADLSGFTSMSELLDPEEVKQIMDEIFRETRRVVVKYGGIIEKYIGDEVMALFGVPVAHEDDPVRAVHAAREIHRYVVKLSPKVEEKIGCPIAMHSGINSGLVITGRSQFEEGAAGVIGDTVNLAARLNSLAGSGEIVIGMSTYHQVKHLFSCEALPPARLKGKSELVQAYQVLGVAKQEVKTKGVSGLRARLIGRKAELAQLEKALKNLQDGKGTIITLRAEAGTGKSRLVEEYKAGAQQKNIQWFQGNAYEYSQNTPYFPVVDLLNQLWNIEDEDSQKQVKAKVEKGLRTLLGTETEVVPYLGSLYALDYPEIAQVGPEYRKQRIHEAMVAIFDALGRLGPTIYVLEDLHWADPSTVELVRYVLRVVQQPAVFVSTYRPPFQLYSEEEAEVFEQRYQEISLEVLSPAQVEEMTSALLESEAPSQLLHFVNEKVAGNPFFLEEVLNSLIETDVLLYQNGAWRLVGDPEGSRLPSTVQGVIAARLDRLERQNKRLLQEASVIGRAFLYDLLSRTTELQGDVAERLEGMERKDLIHILKLEPDLEYMFKHPLTQEVVYRSLLRSERQIIHERVGLEMERLLAERLPEFYESLAFHFQNGRSLEKAVGYLIKSGEKALYSFALKESHQYFQQAYDLLASKEEKSEAEKELLFDLLDQWGWVSYLFGNFESHKKVLLDQEPLLQTLKDKARQGMYYTWLGMFQFYSGARMKENYALLQKAIQLGEEAEDQRVIAYGCNWISATCLELGLFQEAVSNANRAQEITSQFLNAPFLRTKSNFHQGLVSLFGGNPRLGFAAGQAILEYSEFESDIRGQVMGQASLGFGYAAAGDFSTALARSQHAVEIAVDPFYSTFPSVFVGAYQLLAGQIEQGEATLLKVQDFFQGESHYFYIFLQMYLGLARIIQGKMGEGMKMLKTARQVLLEKERKMSSLIAEFILGIVYLQMVIGTEPPSISVILKNFWFLLKNFPFASHKAEIHLNNALTGFRNQDARGYVAQTLLNLGLLYTAKKRPQKAQECITEAIEIFEEVGADVFLSQARDAMTALTTK